MAYINGGLPGREISRSGPDSSVRIMGILGPDNTGSLIVFSALDKRLAPEGLLSRLARQLRGEEKEGGIDHQVTRYDIHDGLWYGIASFPQVDIEDGLRHMWKVDDPYSFRDIHRQRVMLPGGGLVMLGEHVFKDNENRIDYHQWRLVSLDTGDSVLLGEPSTAMPLPAVVAGTAFYAQKVNTSRVFTPVDGVIHKFYKDSPKTKMEYTFPVASQQALRERGDELLAACPSQEGRDLLMCTHDPRRNMVCCYIYNLDESNRTVIGKREDRNPEGVYAHEGSSCAVCSNLDYGWVMAIGDYLITLSPSGARYQRVPLTQVEGGRTTIFVGVGHSGGPYDYVVIVDQSRLVTLAELRSGMSADQHLPPALGRNGELADIANICVSDDMTRLYVLYSDGSERWISEYDLSGMYPCLSQAPVSPAIEYMTKFSIACYALEDEHRAEKEALGMVTLPFPSEEENTRRKATSAPKAAKSGGGETHLSRPSRSKQSKPESQQARRTHPRSARDESEFRGWSSWTDAPSSIPDSTARGETSSGTSTIPNLPQNDSPQFNGWDDWDDGGSSNTGDNNQQTRRTQDPLSGRNDDTQFDGWSSW